jgi:exosortase
MTFLSQSRFLIVPAAFCLVLFWGYWPTLTGMADKWSTDAQYSHGFIVPLFAGYLLWHRRQMVPSVAKSSSYLGIVLILAGVGLHLAGAYFYFDTLSTLALLPTLAGFCLSLGGWPVLQWAWPAIAFLAFMLPLPFRVEVALSHPLQRLATQFSTYALQTVGCAAVSEGNIIILENASIGVGEACNGLGMLVTFFAVTTATVLLANRGVLESTLILISAIPIALIANVVRITVTGILHAQVGGDVASVVFHNLAGWLMIPLALGLLWVEIRLFQLVLVDPEPEGVPVLGLGLPVPPISRVETVQGMATSRV